MPKQHAAIYAAATSGVINAATSATINATSSVINTTTINAAAAGATINAAISVINTTAGSATINAAEKKEKLISYVVSRLHSLMMSRDTPLQDHHFPPRPSPSKATLLHDVRTPPTKDTPEPRIPTPPLVSGLPHSMLSGGTPKLGGNDVTFLQTLIGGHLESIHFLAT